jgi:hypothetical protein
VSSQNNSLPNEENKDYEVDSSHTPVNKDQEKKRIYFTIPRRWVNYLFFQIEKRSPKKRN